MGRRRIAGSLLACLLLALWAGAHPVHAQQLGFAQSAILTVTSERMFAESDFGRRVEREIEADSARLAAENRRIEAELTQEEKELTEKRAEMDPDEFRALADEFDAKVQTIRSTQDAKARALVQSRDAARAEFFNAARPVLADLMREAGAGVILERSSVFLSANATDITDRAIERINASLGDGTGSETPDALEQ